MRRGLAVQIVLALIFACCAASAQAPRALYLGSVAWSLDKPWFGGWSGLELSSDGQRMTAITDSAHILTARILRDGDQITAIQSGRPRRLKASTGKPLLQQTRDAEGLALSPDGVIFVSFEGVTRLARYDTPSGAAIALPRPQAFRAISNNKALEALAIDPGGRLYAFPEVLDSQKAITVFVWDGKAWTTPFTLPGGNGFLPVGADFGPDGQLYLLERGWNIFGFRSRVRRWQMSGDQPSNEQLLIQTRTGTHDNLEGLSIWRDDQGRTRITMIADDNFMFFQRTELVEYALPQ